MTETTKAEARWYSDKQTLDTNPPLDKGTAIAIAKVLPENYDRWKEIYDRKKHIQEIKDYVKKWASQWKEDKATALAELKQISEDSIYTEQELKNFVKEEVDKEKEDKEEVVGQTTVFRQLAQDFIRRYPIYYDKAKLWYAWSNKEFKWELIDETELMIRFDRVFTQPTEDGKIKASIIEALKKCGRKLEPKPPKKTWVQFKDTIIDVLTEEKIEASPEYFITNPIPHKLGESTETPTITKFFNDWVTTKQDGDVWVDTLEEICAYCMLADYPLAICVALLGEGRNGKSTYENFIERLVGEDNVTSADLKKLVRDRFEAWMLYKKLVCLMGEVDFGILKDTSEFKKLTGSDTMKFEKKRHDGVIAKNYAKLIIASNTLPESYDKTDGFFRRWCIVDFPHKFEEKIGLLDKIPKEEYENFCLKCVKVLKKLLSTGTFSNIGTVSDRVIRYEERSNPFGMFIKECSIISKELQVPFWQLYQVYEDFLKTRNFRLQSKVEFGRALRKRGYEISNPRPIKEGTSWRFVLGLDLLPEYKLETEDNEEKKEDFSKGLV